MSENENTRKVKQNIINRVFTPFHSYLLFFFTYSYFTATSKYVHDLRSCSYLQNKIFINQIYETAHSTSRSAQDILWLLRGIHTLTCTHTASMQAIACTETACPFSLTAVHHTLHAPSCHGTTPQHIASPHRTQSFGTRAAPL